MMLKERNEIEVNYDWHEDRSLGNGMSDNMGEELTLLMMTVDVRLSR